MYEAAQIAADAGVERLWLTHFSPAMGKASRYASGVKKIFENTLIPEDGETMELNFDE